MALGLPIHQAADRVRFHQRAAAQLECLQLPVSNHRVDRGAAQAERAGGFVDGVGEAFHSHAPMILAGASGRAEASTELFGQTAYIGRECLKAILGDLAFFDHSDN